MRLIATLLLLFTSASTALAQSGPAPVPSQNFPAGDTAEVYRAALDLLYIDGDEKPKVIVMHGSVRYRTAGPCPQCRTLWAHESQMDTSTIESFASLGHFVLPDLRQFGYAIPLVFLTYKQVEEMILAGVAYDSAHPPAHNRGVHDPMIAELARRYPGAWGWVDFTAVAFNRAHSEALLGIRQRCGEGCLSDEVVFFRKLRWNWTAVERVPHEVQTCCTDGTLPYRGPVVKDSSQSELLVDRKGAPLRSDAKDAPAIYRAVLDSLYSFFGDRPRQVVISGQHARAPRIESLQIQGLDPNTFVAYKGVAII